MKIHVLSPTIVVGVASLLAGCSEHARGLKSGADAGYGTAGRLDDAGPIGGALAGGTVSTGLLGSGGVVAASRAGGGSLAGSPLPDAGQDRALGGTSASALAGAGGVGGIAGSGGFDGGLDAAAGAGRAGGQAGGGAGGAGGTGGTSRSGGSGGRPCQLLTCDNWCNGLPVNNGDGCVNGYRCANGIDPCNSRPCTVDADCGAGSTCSDKLCWPASGAGGVGGNRGGDGGAETGRAAIQCKGSTCAPGQICCLSLRSPDPLGCMSPSECSGELAIACDGPEDCPVGQQCCMLLDSPQRVACASTCVPALVLCHSNADCASGRSCCSANFTSADDFRWCSHNTCPVDAQQADGAVL